MSRTPDQVRTSLLQKLPAGFPFEGGFPLDPDNYVAGRLSAQASELSLIEASMEAMLPEVDIRDAIHLLPDYQRVLGADPCGIDYSALPFQAQAAIAYGRWTAGGDICAGYFEALAASVGTTCTVIECVCWECAAATCDDEMVTAPENFVVVFQLPTDSVTNFECGPATCDDSLGQFAPNVAQCPIEHAVPLHIKPIFSYQGA